MVLFNNIPYKHMNFTSSINLTKRFSETYKCTPNNQTLRYRNSIHCLVICDDGCTVATQCITTNLIRRMR